LKDGRIIRTAIEIEKLSGTVPILSPDSAKSISKTLFGQISSHQTVIGAVTIFVFFQKEFLRAEFIFKGNQENFALFNCSTVFEMSHFSLLEGIPSCEV
jgi:hypothetical protein